MELFYIKLTTGEELITQIEFLEVEYDDEITEDIFLVDPIQLKMFQDPSTGNLRVGMLPWLDSSIVTDTRITINPDTVVYMTSNLTKSIQDIYHTQISNWNKIQQSDLQEETEEEEEIYSHGRTYH